MSSSRGPRGGGGREGLRARGSGLSSLLIEDIEIGSGSDEVADSLQHLF